MDLTDRVVDSRGGDHALESTPTHDILALGESTGAQTHCQQKTAFLHMSWSFLSKQNHPRTPRYSREASHQYLRRSLGKLTLRSGRKLNFPGNGRNVCAWETYGVADSAHIPRRSQRKLSLDKKRIAILLLEGIHASAVDAFQADGYTNITLHEKALPAAQLLDAVREASIIGIRSATHLTRKVLEAAQSAIAVGCFCIGTNQVDLEKAEEHGIPVFNAPFANTRSVAELVLAEIILLMRGIPSLNSATHRGEWRKSAAGNFEVRGKTLGIIGYGHIGTQVGLLAEAVGMQVIFHDVELKLALGNARPAGSLDALLANSDVVTLHVPGTPATCNLIAGPQISRMRRGAKLINASRGSVLDLDALAAALKSQQLSGAALDVFPAEPKTAGEPFNSPVSGMDNVLLTPHVAGSTEEAQKNIGTEVAGKLIRFSNNGSTFGAVNFPEVSLPEHTGKRRLLHIHRNQPGVLSAVNAIFSAHSINIASQYLQTSAKIGYVVADLDTADVGLVRQLRGELAEVAGTIRTRILY
jgi:D-3-phosphoglycerate dehydrogenase